MGLGIFERAGDPLLGVGILEPGDPGILDAHMGIFETLGDAGIFEFFGLDCGESVATGSLTGLCCLITGLAITGPFFLAFGGSFLWLLICPFGMVLVSL